MKIGFIGQGWVGKNYADSFEARGFDIVRYSNEISYTANKDAISSCDIVFIAVPTPTKPDGFDSSIVYEVLPLVGKGKIALIKSTVTLGTTRAIQETYKDRIVLHSPEFLSEATARYDADHPMQNIVGYAGDSDEYKRAAQTVMDILPKAPYSLICTTEEAEIFKYGHNVHGVMEVVFSNMLFDLAAKSGAQWEKIKDAIIHNPHMSPTYLNPVHKSGRGAGGSCFIKDLAAFKKMYMSHIEKDQAGMKFLEALESKNNDLLISTNKDIAVLRGVYGNDIVKKKS